MRWNRYDKASWVTQVGRQQPNTSFGYVGQKSRKQLTERFGYIYLCEQFAKGRELGLRPATEK